MGEIKDEFNQLGTEKTTYNKLSNNDEQKNFGIEKNTQKIYQSTELSSNKLFSELFHESVLRKSCDLTNIQGKFPEKVK